MVIQSQLGPRDARWAQISENQKAVILEKYIREIGYCKSNIGKDFKEVDSRKMGDDESYKGIVDRITDGMIAFKYVRYGDVYKSMKHFYKEWSEYKMCLSSSNTPCSIDGPGDYNPLAQLIGELEREYAYQEALKFYPEYIDDLASNFPGETDKEQREALEAHVKEVGEMDIYAQVMRDYQNAKKLALIESPKPLNRAVQHHVWFYSDKPEEVFKALKYYSDNKVKFMVEKAAKDKRAAIAKKAKEYLDNWDKPVAEDKKKPVETGSGK